MSEHASVNAVADASARSTPAAGRVRLRGHHLVCLQFYRGEGYSAEYVENLETLVERCLAVPALVVDGADDVCAPCPGLAEDGTCRDAGEDVVNALDALALEVVSAHVGDELSMTEARDRLVGDVLAVRRWRARACEGCSFDHVCHEGWCELLGVALEAARTREDSGEST
jgi:hypothetical protein